MKSLRFALLVIATVVSAVRPLDAQAPILSPGDSIGWDYLDADVATYQVNRFEAQYDAGAWAAVGMVTVASANGVTTYKTTPTVNNGTHSILVRACNVSGCGTASNPFAFAVLSAPTSAPSNLRVIRQ